LNEVLYPIGEQLQVEALRVLKQTGGNELVDRVATHLLGKYHEMDLGTRSTRDYWQDPLASTRLALQYQAIADIAMFAEEGDTALIFNEKALEILTALVKKGKVKKAGISNHNHSELNFMDIFSGDELHDPDVQSQLVYSHNEDELPMDGLVHPVKTIQQSKKLIQAGNLELAREEIQANLANLSDKELQRLLIEGPDQVQTWQPEMLVQSLLEVEAYEAANRVASILLRRNPTSVQVNLSAAKSAEELGDYKSAIKYWEALTLLQPDSIMNKRNLAKAHLQNGGLENAFVMYKALTVQQNTPELNDLLELAELALLVEKPEDALEAAAKVIELEPEHTRALTITGLAHSKTGNISAAEEALRKAIMVSVSDIRPRLELAELQWSADRHSDAIGTLKEGLAANPDEREIKVDLAKRMMLDGLISESYPLLAELSANSPDLDSDLLLIEAMDTLGMEGISDTLELMVERYPNDARFLGDYGTRLVWSGETQRGFELLDRLGNDVNSNPDWKLASIEARRKPDYSILAFEQKPSKKELSETLAFLSESLNDDPENRFAQLLKAELLSFAGENDSAYQSFTQLNRENIGKQTLNQARLLTGLSLAASECGEIEIGRAALEQALSLEPDWHALQAIKARIHHFSGEDEEAVNLVHKAVELAPRSAQNQVWAIKFLQQLGRHAEASKLLDDSTQQYPEHLGLYLLKAENSSVISEKGSTDFDEDHLFDLLQKTADPSELVRSAGIFAEGEDHERTIWCLEKAGDLGSEEARFTLAGLYRINRDYKDTQRILEQIDSHPELVDLLKYETLYSSGQTDLLELSFSEMLPLHLEFEFIESFLPGEWKEIFQSMHPTISLGFKIAMTTGKFVDLIEAVRNWLDSDPENNEARVYGIELALASSDHEWYEKLTSSAVENPTGEFSKQIELLSSEARLDHGGINEEPMESFDLFESINADEPEKLSAIRDLRQVGRIAEAETTFEMAMGVFSNLENECLVRKLGIQRNLAKCAFALDRWLEGLSIIDRALELAPASEGLKILRLQGATLAIEFQNRVANLSVGAHGYPIVNESVNTMLAHQDEINVSESGRDSLNRWITRLNLAFEPNKENIHKLAQLSPSAEDAAAMMAGLRANGQVSTALKVGKKFANSPLVMNEFAACELEQKLEMALDWLKKSLECNPHQPATLRVQSILLERINALPESVASLECALDLWPNEPGWHVDAAALWKQLGNTERPLEHLRIASLYNPNDTGIRRLLGVALLSAGKMDEALPHLVAVVEKNPDDYDSWIALSELYQATGDLELALQAADRAAEVNPTGIKAHLQAGKISWSKGDLKKAVDHANHAVSLDSEDPANYVFLARLSKEQGSNGKALELLEKATTVRPALLQTVIEHANLIKEINGVVAARDLISSFSQKFPENPDLLVLLADAEEQCGDIRNAENAAKKALDIKPGEKAIHMLLGKIVEKNGNLDQAAHYYSQAVSLEPAMVEGYLKLSQVYIKQREFTQARQVLEQGIEKTPGNVELYLSCAALLKESKDYRGAELMLRKASNLAPRNVSIHRQLGAILALNMVQQSQEVGSQV